MIKALKILFWFNSALSAAVLLFLMLAFGILTESLTAGLSFPITLPSMVLERDPLGIWISLSLVLSAIVLAFRWRSVRAWIAGLSMPSDG